MEWLEQLVHSVHWQLRESITDYGVNEVKNLSAAEFHALAGQKLQWMRCFRTDGTEKRQTGQSEVTREDCGHQMMKAQLLHSSVSRSTVHSSVLELYNGIEECS